MAKLTVREFWSIAKDEPLYRLAAGAFVVILLIWLGSYVPTLVGAWRMTDRSPVPSRTAVFRLDDGRCVSFASLPAGWTPARSGVSNSRAGGVPPGVAVWQDIEGVPYLATMGFGDGRQRSMDLVSDRRLPELDVAPYKAWQGVDSAIVFLNGEKGNYTRYLWCSTPNYGPRKRRIPTCDLEEDHTDPAGISFSVSFPARLLTRADAIIAESKVVMRGLEHSCDGAIAPPR